MTDMKHPLESESLKDLASNLGERVNGLPDGFKIENNNDATISRFAPIELRLNQPNVGWLYKIWV